MEIVLGVVWLSENKELTCSEYDQSGVFDFPLGIALNPSNNRLYFTNFNDNTVRVCSLTSGLISTCIDSGQILTGGLEGIVVAPTNAYAYVVRNNSQAIYKCTINSFDGTFSDCADSGATGLVFPELISVNSSGTRAYIANSGAGGFVSRCSINTSTGNLSACVNVGPSIDFDGPKQALLTTAGTKAYVTNGNTNEVLLCTVDSNGNFSACVDSDGTGFEDPWGIALLYPDE